MIAYKGFNADLTCRGYRFSEGKTHYTDEANCAANGFHCAEDPLDCLTYYPNWEQSVYYIVEAAGDINEDGNDSKISCTELTLISKLDLYSFVYESLKYLQKHPLRENNRLIHIDKAEKSGGFAIVRGKSPRVKGSVGTIFGIAREFSGSSEIADIDILVIDGKKCKADTWYIIGPVSEKEVGV